MKKLIIFALLAVLSACTNSPNPEVVNRQASVVSSGDGNFGVVVYGQTPLKSFVFKNNGSSSVTGTPTLTGTGFDLALQLGCENIEPGKNCLVKVMFNSTNKESGNYTSSLKVGDSVVNLAASIASVPVPNYIFSVNGQMTDSGSLQAGDLSGNNIKLLTVKVKNNSPKSGQVSNLTLSNNRYRILQTNCNNILLKPNQSCQAKVAVQGDNSNSELATQLVFDNKSSQVSITQIEQNVNGQMIALNSSVILGDFYQEGTNKIQVLKIENQGNGTGNINSSSISLPPGYSIGSNNCSNVKPGSSCIVRLVYSSTNQGKGSFTDTVTIGDGEVDLTVNQVTNPNDLQSLNLTVAANIAVGSCQPLSISLKDSENLDYVSSQSTAIVSSSALYSDSNCSTIDNLVLAPFESAKNLFIKKNISGYADLVIAVKNKTEHQNIFFYSPLLLSSNKTNVVIGQQAQLTIAGGKGPFTVETVSGGGTLTVGGLYTSDTVGTANFKVTDALNQTAQATISVFSNIAITAGNCSYTIPESMTCTVSSSGGIGTKTYTTDVGTINSATGLFKGSCVNNGSSVVTVSDQNNNTAQIILSYPCVYKSCNQLKADVVGAISGVYWIDLDGLSTGNDPFQVYCNQDIEQGGWALVSNASTTSTSVSTLTSSSFSGGNANFTNNFNLYQSFPSFNTTNKLVMINGTTRVPGIFIPDSANSRWSSNTLGDTSPAYYPFIQFITAPGYIYGWGFSQTQIGLPNVGRSSWCSSDGLYLYLNADGTHPGVSSWQAGCNSGAYWKNDFTWQMYDKVPYYKYPISCADAKTKGNTISGTYTIDPDGANSGVDPYTVYCDMVGNNSTMNATGGTITYNGNYKIHTFTTVGNSTFTVTSGVGPIEILVVAGGGGGGASVYAYGGGGGGGAGGLVYSTSYGLSGQTSTTVTIGDGGSGGTVGTASNGSNGFNSSTFGITANGGGGGGHGATCGAGQSGGSGGGAGYCGYGANNNNGGASQGNVGGRVVASPSTSAGGAGGGGAGAAGGSNFPTHNGGIGGAGLSYSISGSPLTYATGGNGAGSNSALNGTTNTGNGGWGAYANSSAGGKGGSGIVIIKYQYKLP